MSSPSNSSGKVRFGDYELDLATSELRTNGNKFLLQGQPFHILCMLLERPGELVTRDELKKRLWSEGTFVDFDHSLNKAVNRLREILADSAEEPKFVETLPRKGYRFIGVVEQVSVQAQTAPIQKSSRLPDNSQLVAPSLPETSVLKSPVVRRVVSLFVLLLTIGALIAWRLSPKPSSSSPVGQFDSVVVLPLEDLSSDSTQEYFADGMTDLLTTALAQRAPLQVISHTTARHYKHSSKSLSQIARELSVDAVLVGTLLRSGNRVRINVQLVDAHTNRHIWAQVYEQELNDILLLQDEVATGVVLEIEGRLNQNFAHSSIPHLSNPEAHELYLKGLYYSEKESRDGLLAGIEYLRKSLELEPANAKAYARIAQSYADLTDYGYVSARSVYPAAKAAALNALQIDANSAEAHASLGWVKYEFDWDRLAAEKEFKRALELNPSYSMAHAAYGVFLTRTGNIKDGSLEIEMARKLDPLSLVVNELRVIPAYFANNYEEALTLTRQVLAMDATFVPAQNLLVFLCEHARDFECAIQEQYKAAILNGKDAAGAIHLRARLRKAYMVGGPGAYFAQRIETQRPEASQNPFSMAELYTISGNKEQAFHWLELAFLDRSIEIDMEHDPEFATLNHDPRFQSLITRINEGKQ